MPVSRIHRPAARRVPILLAGTLASLLVLQPHAAEADNDRYRNDIAALRTQHLVALPAGIVTPPPFDKPAELTEYATNIGLKFVPTIVEAPPTVVVRPNVPDPDTGELCWFRYPASEHGLDPVFDFEDIYDFTLELPDDWGRLDDGNTFMSNASPPHFDHYSTGAFVTVRRTLTQVEDDPEPWYPEQRRRVNAGHEILFTDTNDMSDVVNGNYREDTSELFPIGSTPLTWEAENKLDILFDVMLQPLIFVAEMKYSAKAASKAARTRRFARNWGDPAAAWRNSIDRALFRAIAADAARFLGTLGVEITANEIENATGRELTNWPTGTVNRARQNFHVIDEAAPEIRLVRQPAPFEANTLGGEFGNRHHDELRDLLRVRDNCNRPVDIDGGPRGTPFWPVNQTTTLQWCARDMGPNADGGRNEACVDIAVQVEDTRPPLLLPPPPVNLVSASPSNEIDIGWAGVFDVADPEVAVANDAPATFPVGRTRVTWTATDGSGNGTRASQWINVKPGNTPPTAVPIAGLTAISHDETRIDLEAFESEDPLDGRYDQLNFRIDDAPDNGFFIAPLFPFFIDDHRQHRINPDGSYSSFRTEAQDACTASGAQPARDVILDPVYVTVTDDGVMYVMDQVLTCHTTGTPFITANTRIARFVPGADGELQFAGQFVLDPNAPQMFERQIFIDHREQLWVINQDATAIFVLSPELVEVDTIEVRFLTKISPLSGGVEAAFPDRNRRLRSVAVSKQDVLYATNGEEVFAYDLTRRQPEDNRHYLRLPPVVYKPDQSVVDVTTEEPWASYHRFLSTGFAEMVIDSAGDLYISDMDMNRVWKFEGLELGDGRSVAKPSAFAGWLGKCDANLDPTRLTCDTTQQKSIGFSCEDDLCGVSQGTAGSGRGQFTQVAGIAMSPQDVLYTTDTGNFRVQRFSKDGFFAGEAVSECRGSCFVLGDFGFVTNVAVNSNFFYLLDTDNDLTHIFETTPISDIDDQTMSQTQSAYVTYKSNNNYVGPDAFSFVAYDGLEFSDEATVMLDVVRNHRAPIATPGLVFSGDEDSDIVVALSGLDPDEDTLAFRIDTQPANGEVTEQNGQFVYRPNEDFFGEDQFSFVATDAPGSVPALDSEPEVVRITVRPVNDTPVITTDPFEPAPLVYETQIEALLTDPDLDDAHRVAIDWGDGTVADSRSDKISLGAEPGKVRIIAEHAYQAVSDPGNPDDIVIRICASDAPSSAVLTCDSPEVTATLAMPIVVEPMVDLRIDIGDSLPKRQDGQIPEIMIPDPLLDGGDQVTYTLEVLNKVPSGSDYRPTSTDTRLSIEVPQEMNLLAVATSVGSCTSAGRSIDCTFGDLPPDASAFVDVTAAGGGILLADQHVTLQAEATAVERNVGGDNAGSWDTKLLLNGDLDPDGDAIPNREDAFPGDPAEWTDTDSDGTGNNADRDDDDDMLPDRWEDRYGLDKLDAADRTGDLDEDGLTNEAELLGRTRPDQADSDRDGAADAADNCPIALNVRQFDSNGDGRGDPCDPRSRAAAVTIGDADGDTVTDVALLESAGGASTVYAKSGATDIDIAVFDMLNEPNLGAMLVGARAAAGERAVAMVYSDDSGRWYAAVREAWTGDAIAHFEVFDASFEFVDAAVSTDPDGDALLLLARAGDGSIRVSRRDAESGASLGETAWFDALTEPNPLAIVAVGRSTALVLVDDGTGALLAEARDSTDGSLVGEWVMPAVDWLTVELAASEEGFVLLTTNVDGTTAISTWSLQRTAADATFNVLENDVSAFAFDTGDGIGDASVVVIGASAADGRIEVWRYDALTGLELDRRQFLSVEMAPRGLLLANDPVDGASRVGVLASDAHGEVRMEQRDVASGEQRQTLTADSLQPPAPPPPPPPPSPPPTPGGGGGGGSAGFGLLLSLVVLALRSAISTPGRGSLCRGIAPYWIGGKQNRASSGRPPERRT